MHVGCVLGVATEAVVMAAALCLPQDVFLLPHPTFHDEAADYLHTVCRVQYFKESLGRNLGALRPQGGIHDLINRGDPCLRSPTYLTHLIPPPPSLS
jgi:hypothetical protein